MISKPMILVLIAMFSCNNINQDIDYCKVEFSSIGIRDFNLGTSSDLLIKRINNYSQKEFEDNYSIILFSEKRLIKNEDKNVDYKLTFKDNKLIAYTFMIEVEKGRKGLSFFKSFIAEAKKTESNDFISGDKYSYMKTTDSCKRFIRIHSIERKEFIFGGIEMLMISP